MTKPWKAVASTRRYPLALSAFGLFCYTASAQTSLTVYGVLDVGVDRTVKGQGNVQGTLFGMSGTASVPNASASPRVHSTRLTPSLSAQSHIGFKGTEELAGGYRAGYTLEGGLQTDGGGLANDGRLFGRLAYVSLTTPFGELRLGRQASPMLIGYYLATTEQLGTTDLMGAGLVVNTLQTYQDNVMSFLVRRGPWLGILSHATNAGVSRRISAARAQATSATPAANAATGQIIGGQTAGAETPDGQGRAQGALLAYRAMPFTIVGAVHRNAFRGAQAGVVSPSGTFVPLFVLETFRSAMAGAMYRSGSGTLVAASIHVGKYDNAGPMDPVVRTAAIGIRKIFGPLDLGMQLVHSRFTNFTRGADRGVMAGLDYRFSKRTAAYARIGVVNDDRGEVLRGSVTPAPIAGGPGALLVPLGAQEIPLFSGAGQNMGARTSLFGIGIRHQF